MSWERDKTIKLGDEAKDRITGYEGTVVAMTEWLNGCVRITIQSPKMVKSVPVSNQTFDAEQVMKTAEGPKQTSTPSGGPSIEPERAPDPR